MKVGLFFGSFNPVHIGHMVLANYMLEFTDLEQVWLVVSPHNPLKKKNALLDERQRLYMVELAIGDNARIKTCDIEFALSQPSYTINTLVRLSEKYPQHLFSLIMGSDNLETFHKWKNYEEILKQYPIYVYPRPNHDGGALYNHPQVRGTQAPIIDISSTMIRQGIRDKKNMQYFLSLSVWQYISEMNFYKK